MQARPPLYKLQAFYSKTNEGLIILYPICSFKITLSFPYTSPESCNVTLVTLLFMQFCQQKVQLRTSYENHHSNHCRPVLICGMSWVFFVFFKNPLISTSLSLPCSVCLKQHGLMLLGACIIE